jgi:hypothetical protein
MFVECSYIGRRRFFCGRGTASGDHFIEPSSARRPVSRVLSRELAPAGMAIHLGRPLPDASRDLPGRRRGNPPGRRRLLGDDGRPAAPTWSCSRWGLPCRPRRRERGALLPHPFTLTGRRKPRAGGLLSVALSLGSPPPGVTRHRVPVEPGLSSPRAAEAAAKGGHPAVWPLLPRGRRSRRQAARGGRRAARRSRRPRRRSKPPAGTVAERPARPRESPPPDSRSRCGPARP